MNAPALELIKTGAVWTPAKEPDHVVALFDRLADSIAASKVRTAREIYGTGRSLIEAKESLAKGQFARFLDDPRVGIEPRVAQRFMAIAREVDGREIAVLGERKATLLISAVASPDERKALMSERDLARMSVRGVMALLHPPEPPRAPRQRRATVRAPRPSAREAGFIEGFLARDAHGPMPEAELAAKAAWEARGKRVATNVR